MLTVTCITFHHNTIDRTYNKTCFTHFIIFIQLFIVCFNTYVPLYVSSAQLVYKNVGRKYTYYHKNILYVRHMVRVINIDLMIAITSWLTINEPYRITYDFKTISCSPRKRSFALL